MVVLVHWIVEESGGSMNEWKDTNVAGVAGNRKTKIVNRVIIYQRDSKEVIKSDCK